MAIKKLTSVKAVVEHLGGIQSVAKLTKRSPSNVTNWIALRKFSATTYLVISDELRRKRAWASPRLWGMEGKFKIAA